MLDNILRPFGFQRRARRQQYGKAGGGLMLPILAYLGYRYREPIGRFLREKMGKLEQRGREATTGTPPAPQPF